jgi:hypothetical protein
VVQHVVVIAEASAVELVDLDIVLARLFLVHLETALYSAPHLVVPFIDHHLILVQVMAFPVWLAVLIRTFLKYMALMPSQIS